jgi:Insertion element 4 transposase N-terminal/Transposase DDE domain
LRAESATTTVTHAVTVAGGVYAPGHLGELTQYLPFEVVDDVLAQTRTVQRRLRDLPSRVGVYFLLALGLFPRLGYVRVWAKLTAGLVGVAVPCPSEKALRDLRRRLGPAPLKALFEVVAGPLAQPRTPGVRFGGLRTVAFDGCNSLKVPDTDRNRSWLGRIRYRMGFAGYPTLRLMTLVETGTRGLLGAALGSAGDRDEAALARRLLGLLEPGMLVLLDRAFDANTFLAEVNRTGAMLLARAKSTRNPPVLQQLPDGSYLSCLDALPVRIIEADLRMIGADGSRVTDRYRLITTLLDHHWFPAAALVALYHERWEIESAYLALRHTLLDGHVLRSQDRPGLEQEIWACSPSTSCCAGRWSMRWRPAPAPTPTGPASPLPCTPPETSSPQPAASTPTHSPTYPVPSARPSCPPCCPAAGAATARARSSAAPPATSTATTAALRRPPPSPGSRSPCTPHRSIPALAASADQPTNPSRRPADTASPRS